MNWQWCASFMRMRWRAELKGDHISAWVDPPEQCWDEEPVGDHRWSIEDGSCGKTLDYGYADDLESAKRDAQKCAERAGLA